MKLSQYQRSTCYFLLNFVWTGKKSGGKLKRHGTCYFLLNFVSLRVAGSPAPMLCLLFSFEFCQIGPVVAENEDAKPCYFLLNFVCDKVHDQILCLQPGDLAIFF